MFVGADSCTDFVEYLEKKTLDYLEILEQLFGPRDPRFVLGPLIRSNDNPRTFFHVRYHTEGGCVVSIKLGASCWDNMEYGRGAWQVAHECVHLLDPGVGGTANVLEEGLASWFQNEEPYHEDERVKVFIRMNKMGKRGIESYVEAEHLVRECMPKLIPAVRRVRETGTRIRDVTEDELGLFLPNVESSILKSLCRRFVRDS